MQQFRVSWVAYVWPVLFLLVGSWISFSILYATTIGRLKLIDEWGLADDGDMESAVATVTLVAVLTGMLIAYRLVRKILMLISMYTMRLRVLEDRVLYNKGILPWNKFHRGWYDYQIYDCLFSTSNKFFGWLFDYGDLHIIGKEGTTQQYTIYNLGRVSKACAAIAILADAAVQKRQQSLQGVIDVGDPTSSFGNQREVVGKKVISMPPASANSSISRFA